MGGGGGADCSPPLLPPLFQTAHESELNCSEPHDGARINKITAAIDRITAGLDK